jgi:hypothetical protein
MKPVKPDIGDVTMPLSCLEKHHYDHKGVLVIASAWLVMYIVMFGGFAFTTAFASLY